MITIVRKAAIGSPAMTTEAIQSRKLDIGVVLQTTFQVLGRNLATFTILGLVLAGLPQLLLALVQVGWVSSNMEELSRGNITMGPGLIASAGMGSLAAIITTAILQGALIYATVQDLNGQKPNIAEALANGLRSFLPVIVVSILFALAVGFGMILLLVPGIMIACAWCVAIPSLVADRTGIFGSFSRAADLTRGNRWAIFGLFVVLLVILIVVSAIASAITAAALFANPDALTNPLQAALNPVNIGISVIQQTVSSILGATLIAVLYVELRRLRDGAGPQWLAEIFS